MTCAWSTYPLKHLSSTWDEYESVNLLLTPVHLGCSSDGVNLCWSSVRQYFLRENRRADLIHWYSLVSCVSVMNCHWQTTDEAFLAYMYICREWEQSDYPFLSTCHLVEVGVPMHYTQGCCHLKIVHLRE